MFTSPCYYDGKKAPLSVNWAESWWDRAELEDVKLTAAPPAAAVAGERSPPPGTRVWNHPADVDVDPSYYADPHEPLQPVRLRGLRNGTYSGEIVVSSQHPIRGLNVTVTDLKGPGGRLYPSPRSGSAMPACRTASRGTTRRPRATGRCSIPWSHRRRRRSRRRRGASNARFRRCSPCG